MINLTLKNGKYIEHWGKEAITKTYKDGLLHNEDSAAVVYQNGGQEFYFNGVEYTEEEFHAIPNNEKSETQNPNDVISIHFITDNGYFFSVDATPSTLDEVKETVRSGKVKFDFENVGKSGVDKWTIGKSRSNKPKI